MESLLWLIAVALVMAATAPGSSAQEAIPAAYNPLLSVQALTPQAPATKVAGGYFQLTPNACSSEKGSAAAPACTGFKVSNSADFSGKTNTAIFTPLKGEVMVDAWSGGIFEIGTLNLTNRGFMQPAGAGMTLVTVKGAVTIATPTVNKPTKLPITFQVMWSLGSPAPANQAGLFVLVTKTPVPSFGFKVAMTPTIDFDMNLKLIGFRPDPKAGKDVAVLGDWGQPTPAAGATGPRVFVKEGPMQVVKLYAAISNTAASP